MERYIKEFRNTIYDSEKKYNITITFDPNRFNLSESWSEDILVKIRAETYKFTKSMYLVREPHEAPNYYCHFHGQCWLDPCNLTKFRALLSRKYGRNTVLLNETTQERRATLAMFGIAREPSYDTYEDYCFKQFDENVLKIKDRSIGYVFRDSKAGPQLLKFRSI